MNKLIYVVLTVALITARPSWAMELQTVDCDSQLIGLMFRILDKRNVPADPVEETRKLLAHEELEVTAINRHGQTSLHIAARAGHAEIIKMLIARGFHVNVGAYENPYGMGYVDPADGKTPLHFTAAGGFTDACRELLAGGADPNALTRGGCTPLIDAACEGHVDTCKLLIESKALVTTKTKVSNATALHGAVRFPKVVELLLANGADANAVADGWTPLRGAAINQALDSCLLLIPHVISIPKKEHYMFIPQKSAVNLFEPSLLIEEKESRSTIFTTLCCLHRYNLNSDAVDYILRELATDQVFCHKLLLSTLNHLRKKLALGESCTIVPVFLKKELGNMIFNSTREHLQRILGHYFEGIAIDVIQPRDLKTPELANLNTKFGPTIRKNIARFLGAAEPQ